MSKRKRKKERKKNLSYFQTELTTCCQIIIQFLDFLWKRRHRKHHHYQLPPHPRFAKYLSLHGKCKVYSLYLLSFYKLAGIWISLHINIDIQRRYLAINILLHCACFYIMYVCMYLEKYISMFISRLAPVQTLTSLESEYFNNILIPN